MRNWIPIRQYQEILFDQFEGIARITINRPRYRNAFTPTTVMEISNALSICREDADIRVLYSLVLTPLLKKDRQKKSACAQRPFVPVVICT